MNMVAMIRAQQTSNFDNPISAAIYDQAEGSREDLDHYAAIVEELDAGSVIDIGCGTGTLAIMLADRGNVVTGVDPAGAMLDVARAKPGAEKVHWLHGTAEALPTVPSADLALMTGNVAQVFLTDEQWLGTLRAIYDTLGPLGYLVFETRIPDASRLGGVEGVGLLDIPRRRRGNGARRLRGGRRTRALRHHPLRQHPARRHNRAERVDADIPVNARAGEDSRYGRFHHPRGPRRPGPAGPGVGRDRSAVVTGRPHIALRTSLIIRTLAQQPVGVLVAAALPGALGVAEVDPQNQVGGELFVLDARPLVDRHSRP